MNQFLYRALLRLHPRDFRGRFAGEMMVIFEEAGGGSWLVADALGSLLRQRLLRGTAWRAVPVTGLALACWVLLVWLIARMPLRTRPEAVPPSTAFLLIATGATVLTAVLTTMLALTWRWIRRRPARRQHA